MTPPSSYRDNVELNSYQDDAPATEEPDSPLPLDPDDSMTPESTQPRWLQNAPSFGSKWLQRATDSTNTLPRWLDPNRTPWPQRVAGLLRPRFTVAYILWAIVALYILYCYIFWSPLFASKLPQYTGPHDVGAIDIEVPVEDPRQVVDGVFKADGKPAFQLDTVLFTLYYPAVKGSRSSKPKHKWFPKPISLIAEGYATAAHFNNFFSRPLFTFALWGLASSIDIPAKVDVPLLGGSEKADAKDLDAFPVVVLSHGDVSSRTDYTAYCGELASRGVVVAAIEHRDGSGPGTMVHLPDGKKKRVIFFRANQLQPNDPGKEVSNDDYRFNKLAFRDAEIQETITILQGLNAGNGAKLFAENYRKEGKTLPEWKSRLNTSQTIIAGHSFGATGAMQALKSANKTTTTSPRSPYRNPAIGGIILDPGKESGRLNTDIDVPLLIIHSDSWSKKYTIFYGSPHFDTVRDIARDVLKRCGATWFMTSLQTSHPSITDAPLIEPLLLSWTTGATIDVKEGLREYVRVSMEFLRYLRDGRREGVLDIGVTHEAYGNDTRTEVQREKMDESVTKYWEVHVAPPPGFAEDA
ncbi:PAF-acetylhydrolase family member [Karstenula rhodostoma CBS 690.94]|uniref:Putative phospholipase n=1 Tax=Karstenula rhodostoma CBS 690.94 TaxID=1392251 RepID=A0A9P4PF81_9PLEO|nr:PAF-acetylhydrolase family member [Karstenula rhodostoma CBS 690.94]